MNKTQIEWCDVTWNPVWGCLNDCPYCYARRLAQRFGESFEPHWKEKNFQRDTPLKPSRIFVNSMSEIGYWRTQWWNRVLDRIRENPQHTFLFLTKIPSVYEGIPFPQNCWLGVTITRQLTMEIFADYLFESTWDEKYKTFLSIEPILEPIQLYVRPDWLIIGAETGNRKGKVVPEREWILQLMRNNLPVFMKDSLKPIWGEGLVREWPG